MNIQKHIDSPLFINSPYHHVPLENINNSNNINNNDDDENEDVSDDDANGEDESQEGVNNEDNNNTNNSNNNHHTSRKQKITDQFKISAPHEFRDKLLAKNDIRFTLLLIVI